VPRVFHLFFVITWFLFVFVMIQLKPAERSIQSALWFGFAAVAFRNITIAFVPRQQKVQKPMEILRDEPGNSSALLMWRSGNVISFVLAESLTFRGMVLKFLGAEWRVAGIFLLQD
jgi:cytochrome c oxidase assembly factor CtaG